MRPTKVITVLRKIGYTKDHQTGAHVIMYKEGHVPITVPKHTRDMKRGTLANIVRSTGLSIEEFLNLR
jgi:predicted RNA binding protein YcfA (HicA-like mRNA interferase family)